MDTMPDPFNPAQSGRDVTEVPIREVLGRITTAVDGPVADYVRSHASDDLTLPATLVLSKSLAQVAAALYELVDLWDALHPLPAEPATVVPLVLAQTNGHRLVGGPEVGSPEANPVLDLRSSTTVGLAVGANVLHPELGHVAGQIIEGRPAGPGTNTGERFMVAWESVPPGYNAHGWYTPEQLRRVQ